MKSESAEKVENVNKESEDPVKSGSKEVVQKSKESVKSGKSAKSGKSLEPVDKTAKSVKSNKTTKSKKSEKSNKLDKAKAKNPKDLENGNMNRSVSFEIDPDMETTSRRQKAQQSCKSLKEKHDEAKKSVSCVIMGLISNLYPAAMVGVGVFFLNDCPIAKIIPIWLIVGGGLYLLNTLINLLFICKEKKPTAVHIIQALLFTAMAVWLIFGAIQVYGIFSQVHYNAPVETTPAPSNSNTTSTVSPSDPNLYCEKHVYLFSFISVTAAFFFIGLTCCCLYTAVTCQICIPEKKR